LIMTRFDNPLGLVLIKIYSFTMNSDDPLVAK
jgi:hypothetical protein